MQLHQLKTQQKELLRTLVGFLQAGTLREPIAPFPVGNPTTQFVLYLRGRDSFRFKQISDLDALVDVGLLSFRWNRHGTGKLYTVTDAGYTAVATDFTLSAPDNLARSFNIHDIIRAMSGGMVGISDIGDHIELSHIVQDPFLRPQVVGTLGSYLCDAVRPELTTALFVSYATAVRQLQDEVLRPHPNPQRLEQLASRLSLMDGIPGSLTTMLKAWTYLYPLLLIGAVRSQAGAG